MASQTISIDTLETGLNPRRRFDETLSQLAASIRSQGIIQPIAVRPLEDGKFQVIAGERRLQAARMAGLDRVPVVVHDVDEREARLMALAENTARADMNPVEEAEALLSLLDALDGDHDEAARRLGWSRKKVDARLLLLQASDKVREALLSGKIKLGHAELLSQLPKETQDGTLDKLIEGDYSVAELRKRIEGIALSLAAACFDTVDCQTCPHNSSQQASLFESHIEAGRCANRACYLEKTQAALLEKKQRLQDEWPVVWLDTEKDRKLAEKLDDAKVGPEQFSACQACGNYGCLIRTGLDEAGIVDKGLCFDAVCREQKKAAWTKSQQAGDDGPASTGKQDGADRVQTATKSTASANTKKTDRTVEKLPSRVLVVLEEALRKKAAAQIAGTAAILYGVYTLALECALERKKDLYETFGVQDATDIAEFVCQNMRRLDRTQAAKLYVAIVRAVVEVSSSDNTALWRKETQAATLLGGYDIPLTDIIEVDRNLLSRLPKNTLIAILEEAGFDQYWDSLDENNDFKKLSRQKIADIVNAIENSGFTFKHPPTVLVNHLQKRFAKDWQKGAAAGKHDRQEG